MRVFPLICLLSAAPVLGASTYHLTYGGRITSGTGAPLTDKADLEVRFFDAVSGGNQLGSTLPFPATALGNDGVFTLDVALGGDALAKIFATADQSVFIEITDTTHRAGQPLPRQRFSVVPYALKVPVDGTTITYDQYGALTVPAPAAVPPAGAGQSGTLSASDWTQFNGKPQKSYVDGLNAVQVASVAGLSTGLAADVVNVAGLSTGLAVANANITGLSTGLATTNTNLTATSTNLTALSNAALKKDGSAPLTAPWNVGSQDVTNTGNLLMTGSKVFGLSVATSDPGNLTAGDIGKIWYNGGIRLWNGTSAQSLGIAGAGLMSINSLNSGAQTLSNALTGTTPAWNSAGSTHTLNIPLAGAGGAVAAGLISNAEWVLFNGKQNVLPAANAVTNGYIAGGDWALFNAKQPLLPPGSLTANGYISSADWAAFNAKQPAGSFVTTSRNINTSAPLSGGGNLGSDLTLSLPTGSLSEATSSVLSISGGANAVVGAGTTISVTKAGAAASGYLSSSDWLTFNNRNSPWITNGTSLGYMAGNVGIGTTNPTAKLEVAGNINSGVDQSIFSYNGGTPVQGRAYVQLNGSSQSLQLGTATIPRVTVDASGNVGIGSTAPAQKLDVVGNIQVSGQVIYSGSGVGLKAPFKFYSCSKVASQATGTWNMHTWVDADCSGDTGIPNDNSQCFMATSDFTTASGTACDYRCTMTQGQTYNCIGATETISQVCQYLCW